MLPQNGETMWRAAADAKIALLLQGDQSTRSDRDSAAVLQTRPSCSALRAGPAAHSSGRLSAAWPCNSRYARSFAACSAALLCRHPEDLAGPPSPR